MKKSTKDARDSQDPDFAGSYNAMIRAGQGHFLLSLGIKSLIRDLSPYSLCG